MIQHVTVLFLVTLTACVGEYERQSVGNFKKEGSFTRQGRRDVFENLFNVYDPSFLSAVWPRVANGVHLHLEMSCWDDLTVFFRDLADGRAWAYDAVDASGRYQSGLFSGHRFWLGSKQQCLLLDERSARQPDADTLALLNNNFHNNVLRKQKYFDAEADEWRWVQQPEEARRLAAADHAPPYRMAYTVLRLQLNVTKLTMIGSYDITLGVCFPQSCPHDDVESVINFSITLTDNLKSNRTAPRATKIISARKLDEGFQIGSDVGAIALIVVTVILVTLAMIATLVDYDLLECPYNKQSMSFDLPVTNNTNTKLVDELKRKHREIRSVDDILAETASRNLQLEKVTRLVAAPPIILDVMHADRMSGSCNRCGKYKKQCPNKRHIENVTACPRTKYSSFASLSTDRKERRKKSLFCRLLLCFSLRYSWKRIFNRNTSNKDLSLIHVLRIVATFWIIFVHVAVVAGYASDDAGDINERDNLYRILFSGTIAFDTLFFVSGLFSAHHFLFLKSRYSVRELVSFSGACGHLMQVVCFVTNRIIRLLPSYAYAVLLSGVIARVSYAGSALTPPDDDRVTCRQYWWRNVLYITTLYPPHEQCMHISWYLSTETQLHALGALACAASMSSNLRGRLAVAITAALVLAAATADIGAVYFEHGIRYANISAAYWSMFARPLARVAPYFLGVAAGWLAHATRGKIQLSKATSWLVWAATAPLVAATAWLCAAARGALAAWLHLAWPCALLAVALLATAHYDTLLSGRLSSGCAALSRVCYSAALVHGACARLLLADTALASHYVALWMYFCGTAAVSVLCALLLSLLIEMPCCSVFRRLSECATS